MRYRMYIDEVGNSDVGASSNPNHRYLSLTGVMLEIDYVRDCLAPEMEELKSRYFGIHPDDPVILHRKEMVNRKPPFAALRVPATAAAFDSELLVCLERWDYTVVTVAIDKLEHARRYATWRYDPYHYCLHVLMERYVYWLKRRGSSGDMMAESRGGKRGSQAQGLV